MSAMQIERETQSATVPPAHAISPIGPSRRRAIITIGLMLGMLIAAMESTVISTAMPTVIGDLHGIHLYSWVFSAYLLTSTTTVPIYGKLADLFGRRRIFLIAAGIFLIGSMLSGAAHSMPQLIAFRALQGLGAGGVLPITLTIIGDLYTAGERARVQGLFTGMWGLASLSGPILGAVLTEQLSWRWVFYVNLPFGLLAMLLVGGFLREPKGAGNGSEGQKARIDYGGLVLLTGAVVALLWLLLQLGTGLSLFAPPVFALLLLTVALIALFLRQEKRAPEPLLPLDIVPPSHHCRVHRGQHSYRHDDVLHRQLHAAVHAGRSGRHGPQRQSGFDASGACCGRCRRMRAQRRWSVSGLPAWRCSASPVSCLPPSA